MRVGLRWSLIAMIGLIALAVWFLSLSVNAPSDDYPPAASPDGNSAEEEDTQTAPPGSTLRPVAPRPESGAVPVDNQDAGNEQTSAPEPPDPVIDEEAWKQSFADATVEEIMAAEDALRADIEEKATPILDNMHASGLSELIGEEHVYRGRPGDHEAIFHVLMLNNGGTYRVELPRESYPEIYALKAQAQWLAELARKKKRP